MLSRWKFAVALLANLQTLSNAQRDDNPIFNFDQEKLNAAMKNPDAAGESSIPDPSGFDLSKPWPGTPVPGWKARIEIKADVPVSNNGYTTLTRISYIPPDDVQIKSNATSDFIPTDKTWLPCSNLWASPLLKATSLEDVDEMCSGILPNECANDLRTSLERNLDGDYRFDDEFRSPHCPLTLLPDNCRGSLGNDTRLLSAEPNPDNPLEYMTLHTWYYWEAEDVHGKDDNKAYDVALNRVWVLGTAWGFSKYSARANGTDPNINATITCLHASNVEKVAEDEPGSDGDSNSNDETEATGDIDSGAYQFKQRFRSLIALYIIYYLL